MQTFLLLLLFAVGGFVASSKDGGKEEKESAAWRPLPNLSMVKAKLRPRIFDSSGIQFSSKSVHLHFAF